MGKIERGEPEEVVKRRRRTPLAGSPPPKTPQAAVQFGAEAPKTRRSSIDSGSGLLGHVNDVVAHGIEHQVADRVQLKLSHDI